MSEKIERVGRAICGARRGCECGARVHKSYFGDENMFGCYCGYWAQMETYARAAVDETLKPDFPDTPTHAS